MRALFFFVLSTECTLVVGTDPQVDHADASADAGESQPTADGGGPTDTPPEAAASTCDAGGCNAAKDACKKVCADTAKKCNDTCNKDDGDKSCHDLCNQQLQACNGACLSTCLQCVMGCGTCGP